MRVKKLPKEQSTLKPLEEREKVMDSVLNAVGSALEGMKFGAKGELNPRMLEIIEERARDECDGTDEGYAKALARNATEMYVRSYCQQIWGTPLEARLEKEILRGLKEAEVRVPRGK